jgi:protein phosphatase
MSLKGKLQVAKQTDVGQVRDHNEDYIDADESRGIVVLADGMGGLNAGEVASSMSVHVVMDELTGFINGTATLQADEVITGEELSLESKVVKTTVEKANNAVFHVSQTQPKCRGMGTTIVATLFYDNKVTVAHIGDSRMYCMRDGRLAQVTKDHSFVQELLDKGLYTEDEARNSSQKNVVTRAVGIAPMVEVDVSDHDAQVGDLYLLCSDGLTDLVTDENIERIMLAFATNLEEMATQLVAIANASGGKDNISVVLVKILKPFPARGNVFEKIVDWFD